MRLPDWTQKKWTDELGAAELERAGPAVAGELGSWRIRFRVGRWGIDERGSIKLAFRQVSDWGAPQFEDPGGENYTSLHLESRSGAVLEPRFEWRGYIRHWRQALTVDVLDGALWEGDVITIHLGDTASGSPGMRAQTFNESAFEFKFFVDVFGAGHYQPIPESPSLRVRGGEPVRLVATAISEAAVGDGGWLIVKAEDRHGNPAEGYWGRVRLEAEGAPVEAPPELIFDGKGIAVRRTDTLSFRSAGTARIRVRDEENGFVALSNPIVIREEIAGPRLRWGDFHGGQTAPTLGVGSFDEFYAFARDVGALEFTTHQGNCFEVTLKDMEALKERTRAYHEPGRFVPFLGYEWSGTTPMGGDHALFFFDEDVALHRCSHWLQTDLSDAENDRDHITKVYDTFRGTRTISYPHIGGRPSDLTFHDPELEPVIEIHSKHGTFEWFLEESIERGYRVGFAAGSDDHYGHPGAVYPGPHIGHFATGNGLTALYTGELTREGIWEALKARRCYATNGARILLKFQVNGHWMGEEIESAGPPRIEVEVVGTGSIERVEIFRGMECIHSEEVSGRTGENRLRVLFAGARVRGRGRATRWDGSLKAEGARILGAETVGFIENRDRIVGVRETGLEWGIFTAGDARGFILELDRAVGEIEIKTAPASFTASVGEAMERPVIVEAGGLGQRVEVGRAPAADGPREANFEYVDREAGLGAHAYWVRVTQLGREVAWSSPVWVQVK